MPLNSLCQDDACVGSTAQQLPKVSWKKSINKQGLKKFLHKSNRHRDDWNHCYLCTNGCAKRRHLCCGSCSCTLLTSNVISFFVNVIPFLWTSLATIATFSHPYICLISVKILELEFHRTQTLCLPSTGSGMHSVTKLQFQLVLRDSHGHSSYWCFYCLSSSQHCGWCDNWLHTPTNEWV